MDRIDTVKPPAALGLAALPVGSKSEKMLAGLKDWMAEHNAVLMSVLCLITGVKLIGDAIGALAG